MHDVDPGGLSPEAAVLAAAETEVLAAEARVRREQALAPLARRAGLAWARYYSGVYVVARDGTDIGTVRATRMRAGRRDRWFTRAPGEAADHGPYRTLAQAAAALDAAAR